MTKRRRDFWHPDTCREDGIEFGFEFEMLRLAQEREAQCEKIAPGKKKPIVCVHWLRGLCHRNEITCDSLHVYEPSLFPVCHFFNKDDGRCNNPDCIFRHPSSLDGDLICVGYARGFCERGEKCPHRHIRRRAEELDMRDQFVREAQESHSRIERRAHKYQPFAAKDKRSYYSSKRRRGGRR